jgi:hypothetical protein
MRFRADPALFNVAWIEKGQSAVGCHDFESVLILMGRLSRNLEISGPEIDTTVVHKSWEFLYGTQPKISQDQAKILTGVVLARTAALPVQDINR